MENINLLELNKNEVLNIEGGMRYPLLWLYNCAETSYNLAYNFVDNYYKNN